MNASIENNQTENLVKELKLCNNGYLFAPTRAQLDVAEGNPFVFSVSNGTVYLQSKFSAQSKARRVEGAVLKQSSLPLTSSPWSEGPDYEAWIMSRQEAQMMDY